MRNVGDLLSEGRATSDATIKQWLRDVLYERACDYILWMAGQQSAPDELHEWVLALDSFQASWNSWASTVSVNDLPHTFPIMKEIAPTFWDALRKNTSIARVPPSDIRTVVLLAQQHVWITTNDQQHRLAVGRNEISPSTVLDLLRPYIK